MENEFLKKTAAFFAKRNELKYEAIEASLDAYPVRMTLKALKVSASCYYAWKRQRAGKAQREHRLICLIEDVHLGSKHTYGSPRVHAVLKGLGESYSRSKIEHLMRKYGIPAKTKRKYKATTNSKHSLPVAPNRLNRNVSPPEPNSVWASDITYIWTTEGWLYLAVVMDLYSRKIVAWAMEASLSRHLVTKALRKAFRHRKPANGVLIHSDRSCQYASRDYQRLLAAFLYDMQHEPAGKLLGQQPRGELFPHSQEGTRVVPGIRNSGAGPT